MGEYADLTIWRKLENGNVEYQNYYMIFKDRVKTKEFYKSLGREAIKFGQLAFKKVNDTIYYSHVPVGRFAEDNQKVWKWDVYKKWLVLFSQEEMKIIDNVVFEAETTIEQAIARIDAVAVKDDVEWATFRSDFYCWLKVHAKPGDLLKVSSNAVYCTFSEFDKPLDVNKIIDEKKNEICNEVNVPHWSN